MKITELRQKLNKMKHDEVIKLAVEFYKAVPKAKKDNVLDDLINNPQKSTKKATTEVLDLVILEKEIVQFIEHVKDRLYINPNRTVPKQVRSKWRFKVKRWYKALTSQQLKNADTSIQAQLLIELYQILSQGSGQYYFTSEQPFQSIGIEQKNFYFTTISMLQQAQGKMATLQQCIELIVDNDTDENTLTDEIIDEFIRSLPTTALKEQAIGVTKDILKNRYPLPTSEYYGLSYLKYYKRNHLTHLVFRLHARLYEFPEAIAYFQENFIEKNAEILLYILVDRLYDFEGSEKYIKQLIEQAIANDIQPRKELMDTLKSLSDK